MRLTLIEVLGDEVGTQMYSMDWLRARVLWHLDPTRCDGEVFVVEARSEVLGHTIVRAETDPEMGPIGLFSTIYIRPDSRGQGLAAALVREGEAWLGSRGLPTLVTDTSATNEPLIGLFERHGYAIVLSVPESGMVRLAKSCV